MRGFMFYSAPAHNIVISTKGRLERQRTGEANHTRGSTKQVANLCRITCVISPYVEMTN